LNGLPKSYFPVAVSKMEKGIEVSTPIEKLEKGISF